MAQLVGGHTRVVPVVVFRDVEKDKLWEERSVFHFDSLLSFNQSRQKKQQKREGGAGRKKTVNFSHRMDIESRINDILTLPLPWYHHDNYSFFLAELYVSTGFGKSNQDRISWDQSGTVFPGHVSFWRSQLMGRRDSFCCVVQIFPCVCLPFSKTKDSELV